MDANTNYLFRTNIWSRQIKELLLDELNAMKFVRIISDFPDGFTIDFGRTVCYSEQNFAICWNTPKLLRLICDTLEGKDSTKRGQSAGKDNMKETDLAWLAGIWDGEGSISLYEAKEANGSKKIRPVITCVNTDVNIVNNIQLILLEMGCNIHIHEFTPNNPRHSHQWRFITSNMKTLQTFLRLLLPYLRSEKKARGEIMLRYIEQRMAKIDPRKFNGTTPYDEKDWSYIEEIRSSETTREAA